MDRRLVIDITYLARAGGQAVGILRVTRELARFAHEHGKADFAVFDQGHKVFRHVAPEHLHAIIEGRSIIDMSRQPEKDGTRTPFAERLPFFLRAPALWMRNPRRRAIVALEGLQLRAGKRTPWAEWLLEKLFSDKHRHELASAFGERRRLLSFELATTEKFDLDQRHCLLCLDTSWSGATVDQVKALRDQNALKIALLCHDIIPLLYPECFPTRNAAAFKRLFHEIVAPSDLVLVTGRQVAADIRRYCEAHDLHTPRITTFRPGVDLLVKPAEATEPLPSGLEPQRYALFVSTIEPRKGHRHLLNVWRKLLADGVPQAHGFKLVFVGRQGWMVDDLMREMQTDPSYGTSLIHLSGVNDGVLSQLYQNAAFGLYPSLYEGYGLPVVELFGYGKAVISSSGGALKEVVGDFSPTLDARDENAWAALMKSWIADPTERADHETAITERFKHPTWNESARTFFEAIEWKTPAVDAACPSHAA